MRRPTPPSTRLSQHIAGAAVALVSCFVSTLAVAADDSARFRAIVDAAIRPVMAEYDLPGVAVGVTVDGKAYIFNYGLASREDKLPVTDATMFELGSISKPMTATLATYAQALGKMSLQDHPSKFMPQLKGSQIDRANLLHLGTYTGGGLPLEFPDEIADAQMISYFQQWKADAAPGTQRRYSNPSLGLFGHLAALSMQGDFVALMEQNIFPQFGMNSSYLQVPKAASGNYAWGYDKANKPVRVGAGVFAAQAYGVISTAADVIAFVQANIDPSRLAPPMRRAVQGTQAGHFAVGGMVQGLGWELYNYPVSLEQLVAGNSPPVSMAPNTVTPVIPTQSPGPALLFNKSGSTRGFGNYLAFVPQKKIGVVLLSNKNFPAPVRVALAHGILGQLTPGIK